MSGSIDVTYFAVAAIGVVTCLVIVLREVLLDSDSLTKYLLPMLIGFIPAVFSPLYSVLTNYPDPAYLQSGAILLGSVIMALGYGAFLWFSPARRVGY